MQKEAMALIATILFSIALGALLLLTGVLFP
jgi:hypothetical protein